MAMILGRGSRTSKPAYHLATSCCPSSDKLPSQLDTTCLRVRSATSDEIVDSQLDGFLRCNTLLSENIRAKVWRRASKVLQ
jgi:hypothetical protein